MESVLVVVINKNNSWMLSFISFCLSWSMFFHLMQTDFSCLAYHNCLLDHSLLGEPLWGLNQFVISFEAFLLDIRINFGRNVGFYFDLTQYETIIKQQTEMSSKWWSHNLWSNIFLSPSKLLIIQGLASYEDLLCPLVLLSMGLVVILCSHIYSLANQVEAYLNTCFIVENVMTLIF